MKGQIYKSAKRTFECYVEELNSVISATALREVVKKEHPVVGDFVMINEHSPGDFEITEIIERENEIFRRIVRERKKKAIAANIDVVLIMTSVSAPEYKSFLIDRYLVRTTDWEVPAAIIFNKMDEFENQFDIRLEKLKYEQLGVKCFYVNSEDPLDQRFLDSFNELKEKLKDKTAICLGQSGVGKSKLISSLSDGLVQLESRELAKKVNKGSHTTTWAEMIDCGDFKVIDSPGVRSQSVQDIHPDDLPTLFPDLEDDFRKCKFNDCDHMETTKGCYFNTLNPDEVDEDLIKIMRLASYLKMKEEVDKIPVWERD